MQVSISIDTNNPKEVDLLVQLAASLAGVAVSSGAAPAQTPKPPKAVPVQAAAPQPGVLETPPPAAPRRGRPPKAVSPAAPSPAVPSTAPSPAPAEPAAAAEPPAPEPAGGAAPSVTIDDARKALSDLNTAKGLDVARAALIHFGANRISELAPENYAGFVAHCKSQM
jgi:hypothetical protein